MARLRRKAKSTKNCSVQNSIQIAPLNAEFSLGFCKFGLERFDCFEKMSEYSAMEDFISC